VIGRPEADGIWDVIDTAAAARLVRMAPDPSSAAQALVTAAEGAGAHDNLTAVVISVPTAKPFAVRKREG
jgi:serine/threonine protein phosphatase PrpC